MSITRRRLPAERRVAATAAFAVALVLLAALPVSTGERVRWAVLVIDALALIPLIAVNRTYFVRQRRWSVALSRCVVALLAVVALGSILGVIVELVGSDRDGLLRSVVGAAQAWIAVTLSVALLLWILDRGGPVARRALDEAVRRTDGEGAPGDGAPGGSAPRDSAAGASGDIDLLFVRDQEGDADLDGPVATVSTAPHPRRPRFADETDWQPSFGDYLRFALANAATVVTRGTTVVSTRARVLAGLHAFACWALVGVVVVRVVVVVVLH